MALSILDGNQTATTLSTVVSAGAHIPAHTVVSLGAQAINDIQNGIWGGEVPPSSRGDGDANPNYGIGLAFGRNIDGTAIVSEATPLPISGTVTANVFGAVTVGNSVTISSLPAISGTVTANVPLVSNLPTTQQALPVVLITDEGKSVFEVNQAIKSTLVTALPSGTNRIGVVTVSSLPSGALTTRFGSVTTANTAQLTAAVTNNSRKYLLAQNISAGTVTIGIGFSPTTTQGIQLTAGAGISFDSFCSTGAVWWLGATTGATWTILEG